MQVLRPQARQSPQAGTRVLWDESRPGGPMGA